MFTLTGYPKSTGLRFGKSTLKREEEKSSDLVGRKREETVSGQNNVCPKELSLLGVTIVANSVNSLEDKAALQPRSSFTIVE